MIETMDWKEVVSVKKDILNGLRNKESPGFWGASVQAAVNEYRKKVQEE